MNGTTAFEANQEEPVRTLTTSGATHHEGRVRVMAAADRRSWSLLPRRFSARASTIRKRPVEAAGAVDAKNAPTAPWKTAQNAVSHSYHRLFLLSPVNQKCYPCSRLTLLPMFPVAPGG